MSVIMFSIYFRIRYISAVAIVFELGDGAQSNRPIHAIARKKGSRRGTVSAGDDKKQPTKFTTHHSKLYHSNFESKQFKYLLVQKL